MSNLAARIVAMNVALTFSVAGQAKGRAKGPTQGEAVSLSGAGASFPGPLYAKWIEEYGRTNAKVKIAYQALGSGAGVQRITEKSVDFGASDAPMTDEQLGKASGKVLHIPTALGAVVITYNLHGIASGLKLTPELIVGIFSGGITKWTDPRISAANPRVKVAEQDISVAYRSDNSGTTAAFTDYLSKVSEPWKTNVGKGSTVKWPVGTGAKGNDGVTAYVQNTPGAIGYVELTHAVAAGIPTAIISNQAGKFIWPKVESVTAAAAAAVAAMPDDLRVSITDPPGEDAYPISSYTYLLVYEEASDKAKGEALAKFMWWATHEGQGFEPPLYYASLPQGVVTKVEVKLKAMKFKGQPLLTGK